jgi:hypothetical protein
MRVDHPVIRGRGIKLACPCLQADQEGTVRPCPWRSRQAFTSLRGNIDYSFFAALLLVLGRLVLLRIQVRAPANGDAG